MMSRWTWQRTLNRGATVVIVLVGGVFTSFLLGGFVFGVIHAEGADWSLAGIGGRLFIGIVFAFLTPISLGFPPMDGGSGGSHNTWPYVGAFMVVFLPGAIAIAYDILAEGRTATRLTDRAKLDANTEPGRPSDQ